MHPLFSKQRISSAETKLEMVAEKIYRIIEVFVFSYKVIPKKGRAVRDCASSH